MNSNRGNNRRRGRSNNRSQGGGQHLNRIDSRARGNAPQLLDKYKKLAEEASRNGDRVQAEYYLQFADHYFRVIADGKSRQDEQRQKRDDYRGDRDSDDDSNEDDNDNRGNETANEREPRSRREGASDDNPFVRDNRQRRPRRSRDDEQASGNDETEESVKNSGGLDPQALPPAIGDTGAADAAAEKPKRTRRPRKPKVEDAESDGSDMQQAVNG